MSSHSQCWSVTVTNTPYLSSGYHLRNIGYPKRNYKSSLVPAKTLGYNCRIRLGSPIVGLSPPQL
jgi:hypothetical protein